MPDQRDGRAAMEQLRPFVGEWRLEASLAPADDVRARAVFEWALDGQFLVERSEVDFPGAPDGLCVIAFEPQTGAYRQHYFDSRGVVRLYEMAFDGRVWTLRRESPDFTPLDFAQRYVGEFSADGDAIRGRWERRALDSSTWELDFELDYRRASAR